MSVSKAAKAGKTAEFDGARCLILGTNRRIIAAASRVGSLYYLECTKPTSEKSQASVADAQQESKAYTWHRRFGHLGLQNLQKLARDKMVDGSDFDVSADLDFCETCVGAKHHGSPFPTGETTRSTEPLDLVHSQWRS